VGAVIGPRIGYAPLSANLETPADKRRFVAYARARNLAFEVADANERYDIVVLTEGADISVWPNYGHGKIVYDLIDSYLSVPRTNLRQLLRGSAWYVLGKHKKLRFDYLSSVRAMCARADAVVCTTQEQNDLIRKMCDNVHIILDIHSSVVKEIKKNYVADAPLRVVWEGLPSNLPQLTEIAPILRRLGQQSFELHVVTDSKQKRPGRLGYIDTRQFLARHFANAIFHPWDEQTMAKIITRCDIALIPIDLDNPFTRGKPENKLLLLWRLGMPVVVSATPAYNRAMANVGTSEFACSNDDDWMSALARLGTDETLRHEVGVRGRAYAENSHSAEAILSRWDRVFQSLGYFFGNTEQTGEELAAPAAARDIR
jgi:glycosyltransferase involved in cell wall biosynthesis